MELPRQSNLLGQVPASDVSADIVKIVIKDADASLVASIAVISFGAKRSLQ